MYFNIIWQCIYGFDVEHFLLILNFSCAGQTFPSTLSYFCQTEVRLLTNPWHYLAKSNLTTYLTKEQLAVERLTQWMQ